MTEADEIALDADPFQGAITCEDSVTLAEIWLSLHSNAQAWLEAGGTPHETQDRGLIDGSDLGLLRALESFPAEDWFKLCQALGMTVYGAVALSWCQGAKIEQVFEGWQASGFPLLPKPEFERPAKLIDPKLLPDTTSLRQLANLTNNKTLPLCILISAKSRPIEVDLPSHVISSATPILRDFILKSGRA